MANVHNYAGQYAKGMARNGAMRFFYCSLLTMAGLGFTCGAFLVRGMGYVSLGIFVGIAFSSTWLFKRYVDPAMDRWARERIKYLRGGQAEALVAWILKGLDESWHLFNNLQLEDASDIDHVLVGPGEVWCVSTKGSSRGLLSLSPDGKLLHNLRAVDWLTAVKGQAARLRERLVAILGRDVPFVTPVLAVPLAFVDLRSPQGPVHVLHQDDLLRPFENPPKVLGGAEVQRIANAVKMLAQSAKSIYRRPDTVAPPAAPTVT